MTGMNILVEGLTRARARSISRTDLVLQAAVEPYPDPTGGSIEVEAHVRRLRELVGRAAALSGGAAQELQGAVLSIDDPLRLCYLLASLLDIKAADKQALLETDDLAAKLGLASAALSARSRCSS